MIMVNIFLAQGKNICFPGYALPAGTGLNRSRGLTPPDFIIAAQNNGLNA
jgi:hypothetical protein